MIVLCRVAGWTASTDRMNSGAEHVQAEALRHSPQTLSRREAVLFDQGHARAARAERDRRHASRGTGTNDDRVGHVCVECRLGRDDTLRRGALELKCRHAACR